MARAFSTFANDGERIDGAVLGNTPRSVLWVARNCDGVTRKASKEDCAGVDENAPVAKPALDTNKAAILTSILQTVVSDGTGKRAALGDRVVAGKTGTTENYGDAWFVGYTPQLAVAVWVGYPKELRPMLTEFEGGPVAGGTFPAEIWKTFTGRALQILEEPPEYFTAPVGEYSAPYEVVHRDGEWFLDNGNCSDTRLVVYVVGSEPAQEAACKPNEVDVPEVVGAKLDDAVARSRACRSSRRSSTAPPSPVTASASSSSRFPPWERFRRSTRSRSSSRSRGTGSCRGWSAWTSARLACSWPSKGFGRRSSARWTARSASS